MKGSVLGAAGVAVVLAGSGLAYVLLRDDRPQEPVASAVTGQAPSDGTATTDPETISFPAPWRRQPAEPGDEPAGVLLRLNRSQPDATFLLRRIIGKTEVPLDTSKLAEETSNALRGQVEDFVLVDKGAGKRDGHDVVKLDYIQGREPEAFRVLLLVVPTPDRTYYLTFRAPSANATEVRAEYDQITDSFFQWQQRSKAKS